MLKDRRTLESYLENCNFDIAIDNEKCKEIYDYANSLYNIPKSLVLDYMTQRKSLAEASEFELFILLDSILKFTKNENKLTTYFTEKELKFYSTEKFQNENIKFPLEFKAIQITNDQWIGKIDVKTLMKFRKAQLINYDANTQRVMTRIVRNEKVEWKITTNKKSVNEIAREYENNTFIPNTITLNIPTDSDADFYYDEETCTLIINKLDHFNITDGYHRYLAEAETSDKIPDFDYPMELRIINFTDDKAKRFISQEEHKNHMKKLDSKSMDMNNMANITVERLNDNVNFNLKGLISRNRGIINFPILADLVEYFYFKNSPKSKSRIIMIQTVKELTDKINEFTECYPEYLEKEIDYSTILSMMFCFNYYKDMNKPNINEIIIRLADRIRNTKNPTLRDKRSTPKKMRLVEQELLEVLNEMEGK